VANAIQMSYIATNHFLNPETRDTNDPLLNSLTVSVGPLARLLHLNFNYHVEHHVLPSMNPRHAPLVRDLLVRKFGDRYHEMPYWKAIYWLYRTPRVHWDADHLVNPRTGTLYHTIEPGQPPRLERRLPVPVPRPRAAASTSTFTSMTMTERRITIRASRIGTTIRYTPARRQLRRPMAPLPGMRTSGSRSRVPRRSPSRRSRPLRQWSSSPLVVLR